MPQPDDSRWRGYVALAILGSLVGIHLWVRSLNSPQEIAKNDKAAEKIAIDPDIDPKLPPAERDRLMRERALRKLMDQQTADLRKQAAAALAQGSHQAAADLFRKVLKIDSANEEAKAGLFKATDEHAFVEHFGRGQEALEMGDLETAFFEFDKAHALKPTDPEVEPKLTETKVRILLRDARRAEEEQHWDDAMRCYEQALKLKDDPKLAEEVRHLKETVVTEATRKRRADYFKMLTQAEDLERDGKIDEALALYRKARSEAVALNEDPGPTDRLIADCAGKTEDYEKLANIWYTKAKEFMAKEQYDDAIAAAGKVPKNLPGWRKKIDDLIRQCADLLIRKEMVEIPAGEFVMGGVTVGDTAIPQRRVQVKRFFIDRHEVSHIQYQKFIEATNYTPPEYWKGKVPPRGSEEVPVVAIAYEDALAYATWKVKRLPTEEEWEKAARGSDGRTYPWGNTFDAMKCNSMALRVGKALPMPVGAFPKGASPYGCTDMAGNAMEWTSTEASLTDASGSGRARIFRILKGGSFLFNENMCQCGARLAENQSLRLMGVGFRCVKDVE